MACELLPDECYVNTVGTFGFTSAGIWWDTLAALLNRCLVRVFGTDFVYVFVYADDWYVLLAVSESMSGIYLSTALVLSFFTLVGIPLHPDKLILGPAAPWVGFDMRPFAGDIGLLEEKRLQALSSVRSILRPSAPFGIKTLSEVRGLLAWIAGVYEQLKPFLQVAFTLERGLPKEVSWKRCPDDLVDDMQVWEQALSVKNYRLFVETRRIPYGHGFIGDACAASGGERCRWPSKIGIGGWLFKPGVTSRNEVEWFAEEITVEIFPWLAAFEEGHRAIAAMEMLVVAVCLKLWGKLWPPGEVCIPTLTDNLGNVYALGKWYTKEPPSAWVLREVAAEATALGHELIVEHVRGVDNTWADELSRGYLEGFSRSLRREPLLAQDGYWRTPLRGHAALQLVARAKARAAKRARTAADLTVGHSSLQ